MARYGKLPDDIRSAIRKARADRGWSLCGANSNLRRSCVESELAPHTLPRTD